MRNFGPIAAGAGVVTNFNGSFAHQYLQIGDGVTPPDIRGLQVSIGGSSVISLNFPNNAVLDVIQQLIPAINGSSDPANSESPFIWQIATGFLERQSLEIAITNDGAGTPEVRIFSDKPDGVPVVMGTSTLQPSDNQYFNAFDLLVFQNTNFDYANIKFASGYSENNMDAESLRGILAAQGVTITSGLSSNISAIVNNPSNPIEELTLFSTAGGTLTVANVLYPA